LLQIATGKYFRDVPLHVTPHQRVLFTNSRFLSRSKVALAVGDLFPSDEIGASVSTIAVNMTERLEAIRPDGGHEMLASTGGNEMLDDLAYVLSFALNSTFSRNHDLVRRLIPDSMASRERSSPAWILRRTCDPGAFVSAESVNNAAEFLDQLLALNRTNYERTMRAIRQVVNACRRVADDPTLSYTMLVAALEALAPPDSAPPFPWSNLDGRKRKLIDAALVGLDDARAEGVRLAVIEAERAGAKRRFVAFVLAHVTPDYYRKGAIDAVHPPSATELARTLKRAYDIRSNNVHDLADLLPETWSLGNWAETVNPRNEGLMLSIEGLNRLARAVIRKFVAQAPTEQLEEFDYRSALPNLMRVELAPQYWIGNADGLSKESAGRYFDGFVSILIETFAPTVGAVQDGQEVPPIPVPVDLRSVLNRIEQLAPHVSGRPRLCLIAIYWLWHRFLIEDVHMSGAELFITKYGGELDKLSIHTFVLACLSGDQPEWTTEELQALADDHHAYRTTGKADPLPKVFNAALAASVALRLAGDDRREEATKMLSQAVEEYPGSKMLMEAEAAYIDGGALELDLRAFVFGKDPSPPAHDNESVDDADPTRHPPLAHTPEPKVQ
jgi:hypothetical protein